MIIDCISDLHGNFPKLKGGDLLIIAGDLTSNDKIPAWKAFYEWLYVQEYKKMVYIGGNHDNFLTHCRPIIEIGEHGEMEYLCDSGTEFEGLKIWGSPWTKTFKGMNPRCKAFTCETEGKLKNKCNLIPRNTNILITHSPPFDCLDTTIERKHVGSESLLDWISDWKPRLHVFGHIHEAYGQDRSFFGRRNFGNKYGVTMVNASHVNERYEPVNEPIRIELT